ncbi:MAG: hypothetical protein AAFU57_09025 [Bacteroidota bacterium]
MKKNQIFKFSPILLLGMLCLACQDDDNDGSSAVATNTDEVKTQQEKSELDRAVNHINGTVTGNFDTQSSTTSRNSEESCASITLEENDDEGSLLTIDYGEACTLPNEDVVSGKIKVTYLLEEGVYNIVYELENYQYNDIAVSGSATATYNQSDSRQYTYRYTSEFEFEWPDGLEATDTTTYSIETFWEDSEESFFSFYQLTTGDGQTAFNNGDTYSYEITTPLRTESGCRYIVSGVWVQTENTQSTTLDYGDGTCDNEAEQTDNDGNTIIIDLDDRDDDEESDT